MTDSIFHPNSPDPSHTMHHNFLQNFVPIYSPSMLTFSAIQSRLADMPTNLPLPPSLPKLKRYFNQLLQSKPVLRTGFVRLNTWDSKWIIWFNLFSHRPLIAKFFQVVSRLGDGWIWAGATGVVGIYLWLTQKFEYSFFAIYTCLLTSAVGYTLYKYLKTHTVRPRPYQVHQVIRLGERPLDVFSFPSGHTLQAVIFTLTLCHFVPVLSWVLGPFMLLIAISRMILGLHYPTDVAMGAFFGVILAKLGLNVGEAVFRL